MGPFPIVIVQPNTPAFDELGIHNTVSINHATLASSQHRLPTVHDLICEPILPSIVCEASNSPTEYAIDRIVGHGGSEMDLCYSVCWHEFYP